MLRDGRYHLHVSTETPVQQVESQGRIVALDPGVRTFRTFYAEEAIGQLGDRACGRIRLRLRNLVDELHHQTAHWLVRNYDIILLPDFRVAGMAGRAGRNIRRQTVRNLLTLSHHRFKAFLRHKAAEFGKQVVIVNEAHTSRTCSRAGEIIPNLGGRKMVAGSDDISLDRDVNGARGIFLRALVDTPWLQAVLQLAARSPE